MKNHSIEFFRFFFMLFILTYIFHQGDSVEAWGVDGWFYRPFLRGTAGMCIGVACGYFLQNHKDSISLLFAPFVVLSCFYEKALLHKCTSNKIWDRFGGIAYAG